MKRLTVMVWIGMGIVLAAIVLNGCLPFSRGVGQTVAPELRLPLQEGGPYTGAWVARDLVFYYEYVRQGGDLTVKGTVEFRGGVSNFPVIQTFYLETYYLNAAGQVIAVGRLYNSGWGKALEPLRFIRRRAIPPEAVGWAIGYSGRAIDNGPAGESADWSFWDTPFK